MIELVIISLAAWYVAHNITLESGPFNVFGRARTWAQRNVKDVTTKGSLAEAITCIYCMAFWAAALLYALWFTPIQPAVYILAAAGGVLVADRWISS